MLLCERAIGRVMEVYITRIYYENYGMQCDRVFKTKEEAEKSVALIKDDRVDLLHLKADDSDLLFTLVKNNFNSIKHLFTEISKETKKEQPWYVYMLQCKDGTIYTGATTDVKRRVKQHNNGIGARYTCGRRPVTLLISIWCRNKSEALKKEARIKGLSREDKLKIINGSYCGGI